MCWHVMVTFYSSEDTQGAGSNKNDELIIIKQKEVVQSALIAHLSQQDLSLDKRSIFSAVHCWTCGLQRHGYGRFCRVFSYTS